MENPKEIVEQVWKPITEFLRIPAGIKPALHIVDKSPFGTRDISECPDHVIVSYCEKKLKEELAALGTAVDFKKLLAYALAESLAMGAQKMLIADKCSKNCSNCRAFCKSKEFKRLNYVTTYYIADHVMLKLFNENQFGMNQILRHISNESATLICKALEQVYARSDSDEFIRSISCRGDLTFSDVFAFK
ncbi:MAG: hypothetical protein WC613_04685 [Candidatus Aenigmatarchaeota archaeon]